MFIIRSCPSFYRTFLQHVFFLFSEDDVETEIEIVEVEIPLDNTDKIEAWTKKINDNIGRISQEIKSEKERTMGHIVVSSNDKKRKRCKYCGSKTVFICNKCKVPLHTKCFLTYHQAS